MKKIILFCTMFFCYLQLIYPQLVKLDSSFGNNGIVSTKLGKPYVFSGPPAYQILPQSDGSMYVIEGNSLVKRGPDGYIDSSFQIEFSAVTNINIKKAAIQPDGKIVTVGAFGIVRYNPGGSIDSSFSKDGEQTTGFGEPYLVALQKNGKIVVVAGTFDGQVAIARYKTDGSLDEAFNGDGKVTNNLIKANSMAIQPDGKIVVAGSFEKYDPHSGYYYNDFAVMRYDTDGSLDNTFSSDGIQTTDFNSGDDNATSVAVEGDGKIVLGGYTKIRNDQNDGGVYFALVMYNPDGSLDKSFSDDGKQTTSFGTKYGSVAQIYSLTIQSDGKIVVTGNNSDGNTYFIIARYNKDGNLDKSFSVDGITSDFGDFGNFLNTDNAYSVAIQTDGKIVAAGSAHSRTAFVRYNSNGSPDNTFGVNGKLIDGIKGTNTIFRSTAVQKDGKIVAVGKTWNGKDFDFAIVRYDADGSLDNTFNGDGIQTTGFGLSDDYANAVAIQNDGKIVVGGYSGKFDQFGSPLDSSMFSIARYNFDGSLDNTFDNDGKVQTSFGGAADNVLYSALAIQADGKIVAAGCANNSFAVARYNTDGSLDNSFDEDGKQTIQFENIFDSGNQWADGYATSVSIANDGKIVVAGINGFVTQTGFSSFAILNNDGRIIEKINGTLYAISCAATVLKDGKIALVTNRYDEVLDPVAINLYTPDGSIVFTSDKSIDKSHKEFRPQISDRYPGDPNEVTSIALQNDTIIAGVGEELNIYHSYDSVNNTLGTYGGETSFPLNGIAVAGNRLYTTASAGSYNPNRTEYIGTLARYLLADSQTPPTVTLTTPTNNTSRLAPAAHIKLSAAASDKDGTISKVEFYSGTHLLHTETVIPYGFVWRNVPLGNYTLTAKAYDNDGLVTTSAPVYISVVPNKPPVVSIINPKNNETFAASTNIQIEADAKDLDGRMTRVEFYNGSALLNTQYLLPYRFVWKDVPAGTYTITAVARDNWGASTTSAPVTFRIIPNTTIVSSKPASVNNKTGVSEVVSLTLAPNPANGIINMNASGLQQDKPATIRVLSASGVVMKTMHLNNLAKTIQLDVSSLVNGVYTIQFISSGKTLYKQFVKL